MAGRRCRREWISRRSPNWTHASLQAASAFVKFLAPPAPLPVHAGDAARAGVSSSRCSALTAMSRCFGPDPVRCRALRYQRFTPYTDLLLHDLGRGRRPTAAMVWRVPASSAPSRSSGCSSSTCSCMMACRRRWTRRSSVTAERRMPPAPCSTSSVQPTRSALVAFVMHLVGGFKRPGALEPVAPDRCSHAATKCAPQRLHMNDCSHFCIRPGCTSALNCLPEMANSHCQES